MTTLENSPLRPIQFLLRSPNQRTIWCVCVCVGRYFPWMSTLTITLCLRAAGVERPER